MEDIYKAYKHAGYPGRDAMRENAIKEFGGEMKGFDKDIGAHGSFSAPSRTKIRLYKRGGHVGAPHSKIGTRQGGSLTDMHFPKPMGFGKSQKSDLHIEKGRKMKRGRMEHHRHKNEYEHGGHTVKVYKTGGHTTHGYSRGGNVYEREMMGESHHHRANNYESMMRGEHCSAHAGGNHHMDKLHHNHETLSGLRHGGHAHPRGKHARFAAGGVAKVRHNQATSSGRQMSSGPSKVKVY